MKFPVDRQVRGKDTYWSTIIFQTFAEKIYTLRYDTSKTAPVMDGTLASYLELSLDTSVLNEF